MPVPQPPVFDLASMTAVLAQGRQGSTEVLGALDGLPLFVVDLDTPGDATALSIPAFLPCVIVGISCHGNLTGTSVRVLDGVDVALTGRPRSPSPWVSVRDVGAALQGLATSVGGSPLAAVTLAQVLRSGRPDSLDHDLVLESLAYSTLQGGPEFHRWLDSRRPPSRRAPHPDVLRVERVGDRLSVTLNRPEVANAYNASMRDGLCSVLSQVNADPSIEEVHLYGAGRDFCSGGDLVEFGMLADPAAAHLIRTSRSVPRLLATSASRVVAHLHGACIGAGIELPAMAATVLAQAGTRIRLPELAMGLIPGSGGTASLPRRIGRHRTAWMALGGRSIDAATALDWGLVDQIVPE